MTEHAKKLVTRIGLAVLLSSLPVGVIAAVAVGGRPPAWVYVLFGAGVLIAALPGFFPAKPGQVRDQ